MKTNPKKIPATMADVNKARREGIETGIRQALKIVLYILLDKHDAPVDDLIQLSSELRWLAGNIISGKMSWNDVDRVLSEYDITVNWI